MKHAAAVVLALASLPALAQFKCTGADGRVSFQQQPCEPAAAAQRLELPPPAPEDPRQEVRDALARGRFVVGMNRSELDRVMGPPASVTRSWIAGKAQEQLVYRYPGRTVFMYMTDGVLTSFQDSERARNSAYN